MRVAVEEKGTFVGPYRAPPGSGSRLPRPSHRAPSAFETSLHGCQQGHVWITKTSVTVVGNPLAFILKTCTTTGASVPVQADWPLPVLQNF